MATIRDPVTGADPLGSLYHGLVKAVDERILKKKVGRDGSEEQGGSGMGDAARQEDWGEDWEEVTMGEGDAGDGNGIEKENGEEGKQEMKG